MNKNTIVKTNDPNRRKFVLKVQGPVERVVSIRPSSVYLYGTAGQTLTSEVTIQPSEKYPFSILEMKQRQGSGVAASLHEPESKGGPWKISIQATAPKVTNLYDNLTLETDSKYRPTLKIRVSVMFSEPKQKQGS